MNSAAYSNWYKLGSSHKPGVGEFFEFVIQLCYSSVVSRSDVVLDGGASRGRHTVPMSRLVGENGLVFGFEAIPELASRLQQKCTAWGLLNVRIEQVALGNPETDNTAVEFHYVQKMDGYSGIKERRGIPESAKDSAVKIVVPLSKLDSKIDPSHAVRFIKLDLEGGEYHALLGAERIMTRDRPFIVFENGREHASRVYGYTREQWFSLFYDRGYEVFDLFGQSFTASRWYEAGVPWYFIGVSEAKDKEFVKSILPNLVSCIYECTLRTLKSQTPSS